jgi:hypothetical protein
MIRLSGFGKSRSWVVDMVHNARRSPPFRRLADVPKFQLKQVGFSIGARDRQRAKLTNRVQRFVTIAAMGVLARNLPYPFHLLPLNCPSALSRYFISPAKRNIRPRLKPGENRTHLDVSPT